MSNFYPLICKKKITFWTNSCPRLTHLILHEYQFLAQQLIWKLKAQDNPSPTLRLYISTVCPPTSALIPVIYRNGLSPSSARTFIWPKTVSAHMDFGLRDFPRSFFPPWADRQTELPCSEQYNLLSISFFHYHWLARLLSLIKPQSRPHELDTQPKVSSA